MDSNSINQPKAPFSGVTTNGSYATGKEDLTGNLYSNYVPTPAPVDVTRIGGQSTINFPTVLADNNNYQGTVNGVFSTIPVGGKTTYSEQAREDTNAIHKLWERLGMKESDTANALNTPEIQAKQQRVQDLTNQINSLKAETEASKLSMEGQAGRGITASNVALEQSFADKQSAIKALTLGAQLSAEQGNLKLATDQITKSIELQYKPIEDELAIRQAQLKSIEPFLTAEQKAEADKQTAKIQSQRDKAQQFADLQKAYASEALKQGDAETASKIASAKTQDELSQAISGMSGTGKDKKTQVIELSDGSKALIDSETGTVIKNYGNGNNTGSKQDTQTAQTMNSITNILNDSSFDSTFGVMNYLSRTIPGTDAYRLNSEINNVIQNLALAARGQLKGQGQISDFEGKMLRDAQTALKMNMTPDQARKELTKVYGAIRTSSGLSALVKITDSKTGQSQVVEADSKGITQAIKDGLQVEYQ